MEIDDTPIERPATPSMNDTTDPPPAADRPTDRDADAINDEMVRQMERRRLERPERRQRSATGTRPVERRRVCGFCFQPGDHRTAAQCLGALER